MRDYAELVKALRCCSKIDARNNGCDSCPYEYCGEDCQNLCGYAADAIEELLAAVPKWISVEERLPKSGERVLIMFKPFEDDENISIGWLTKSDFDCYDDSVNFFRSVTHWMPLPEPPKEETE